jgi:putative ABC transport system substrate-binding protein
VQLSQVILPEVNDRELGRGFVSMMREQIDAAILSDFDSFLPYASLIVGLAEHYRLPIMYPYRDYVERGGLMAYDPELGELAQRLAEDVDQILHGVRAREIPIYQPTKVDLTINLKAIRSLDAKVQQFLLARADEVIE